MAVLPVGAPLGQVLPGGGLQAGSAVAVNDLPLLLAVAAAAAGPNGTWAAVALPELGGLAAQTAGLDLTAGLWVDQPGPRWAEAVAAVAECVQVVLAGAPRALPGRTVRRTEALLRRHGTVLVVSGNWPGARLRLAVTSAQWVGVGEGHGILRARRVRVAVTGRGGAAEPAAAEMWLPGPLGRPQAVGPAVDRPASPDAPASARAALRPVG